MPFISLNYNYWEFWENYNPTNGYYGSADVAFDGPNKLVLVGSGITTLTVKRDLFSVWKKWVQVPNANGETGNAAYLNAFSSVGGDEITATEFLGATFFLENGWRIQPWPGEYILNIQGNLYTREIGGNPVNPTPGVSVSLVRSNLVDGRIAITPEDYTNIANQVWDTLRITHNLTGTYGEGVSSVQGDVSGDVLTPTTIADTTWAETLDNFNYDTPGTAGYRLWTMQKYGGYQNASVWLDTINGTAGVESEINGTIKLPSVSFDEVITVANNNNIRQVFVAEGSAIDISTVAINTISGFRYWGYKWVLALGGVDTNNMRFEGCEVTGLCLNTTQRTVYKDAIMSGSTHGPSDFFSCCLLGILVFNYAGTYTFDNCFSGIAGVVTPIVDLGVGVGAQEVNIRHFSGGMQFNNIKAGDNISIEGEGQIILDSSCDGGTIAIRGHFTVIDNSGAAVTISDNARFDRARISEAVWDEPTADHLIVGSTGKSLTDIDTDIDQSLSTTELNIRGADSDTLKTISDEIDVVPTVGETADAVWDEVQSLHVIPGTMGESQELGAQAVDAATIADAVWDEDLNTHNTVGSAGLALTTVREIGAGRWKIDEITNRMTMYDQDGVTPLVVFDLKDNNGDPTSSTVFERVPL